MQVVVNGNDAIPQLTGGRQDFTTMAMMHNSHYHAYKISFGPSPSSLGNEMSPLLELRALADSVSANHEFANYFKQPGFQNDVQYNQPKYPPND